MADNFAAQQRLTDLLGPGEHLIWWDRPPGGILFRNADMFLIPFSLLWAGFAGVTTFNGRGPLFAQLLGILFGAAGMYFVFGRFIHDAWRRQRTVYGLTNERAIIARPSQVKSISLGTLSEIDVMEHGGGTGTILFGPPPDAYYRGYTLTGEPHSPAFERIADVRQVYSSILDAQKRLRAG